jgi:hypothetical protein
LTGYCYCSMDRHDRRWQLAHQAAHTSSANACSAGPFSSALIPGPCLTLVNRQVLQGAANASAALPAHLPDQLQLAVQRWHLNLKQWLPHSTLGVPDEAEQRQQLPTDQETLQFSQAEPANSVKLALLRFHRPLSCRLEHQEINKPAHILLRRRPTHPTTQPPTQPTNQLTMHCDLQQHLANTSCRPPGPPEAMYKALGVASITTRRPPGSCSCSMLQIALR